MLNRSGRRRLVAAIMGICLLFAALAPSLAAAECCEIGGAEPLTGAPNPLAFGLVKVNNPSKEEFVTYTSTENVKLGTPQFGDTHFKKGTMDNCTGQKVAAAGKCKLGIIFTPTAVLEYHSLVSLIYEVEATKKCKTAVVGLEGAGE
jgi:hypothetical protein